MIEKDLKKLRRAELLEIMLDQSYEIDQLRKRVKELEEQLEDREIIIENAGSIFLGKMCPEALGDYFSGTNHTLPTSGTAKFSSPLSVDDFVKKSQFIYYTADALSEVADKVAAFATKEGLTAHAKSATIRTEGK